MRKFLSCILALAIFTGALSACTEGAEQGGAGAGGESPSADLATAAPEETVTPTASPAPESPAVDGELEPIEIPDLPEDYTKAKTFFGSYSFTTSDVVYAMNEDETKFYAVYKVMSHESILEGVVENGVCTVTDDHGNFAAQDAQQLYEDAMGSPEPWHPVSRGA